MSRPRALPVAPAIMAPKVERWPKEHSLKNHDKSPSWDASRGGGGAVKLRVIIGGSFDGAAEVRFDAREGVQ